MKEIINILVARDGISEAEAKELIAELQDEMQECDFDYETCVDLIEDYLGLEPDYIPALIGFQFNSF